MNIALVIDYSFKYIGGAQTAFISQANALADSGHNVFIVSTQEISAINGGKLVIPAKVSVPSLEFPIIINSKGLRKRIAEYFLANKIEAVHVHSEFALAQASLSAARELGIVSAITVHTFFWQVKISKIWQKLLASAVRGFYKIISGIKIISENIADNELDASLRAMTLAAARNASFVISPSAHQAKKLINAGIKNIEVLPNTIAIAGSRSEALAKIPVKPEILWVGRVAPEKRLDVFLAACNKVWLSKGIESFSLKIIGEGPDSKLLQQKYPAHENLHWLSSMTQRQVLQHMSESNIVALSSYRFDNQPMIVVEATFSARGVIYVDDNLQEGLDKAGYLCANPDESGIFEAIEDLIDNPEKILTLSRKSYEAWQDFAPEQLCKKLTQYYKKYAHEK